MSPTTKREKRGKSKKRVIRFKGICADARTLGVNRITLYKVLNGERPDLPGLRRRYDELKAGEGAQ